VKEGNKMKKIIAIIIILAVIATSVVALVGYNAFVASTGEENNLKAVIVVDKTEANVNENITFDATNSTGDIVEWIWDFGYGNVFKDPRVTFGYGTSNHYYVYLTVIDKKQNKDIQSVLIKINNEDFMDDASGQIVMTPMGGVYSGATRIFFPVFRGTSNATVYTNWSIESTLAYITVYANDNDFNYLYNEDIIVNGAHNVNEIFTKFECYGEDYRMGIACDSGNIQYTLEVTVCY
jgi:hypothetical protein